MKEKAGSENALPFLISTTYCGSGILTKSCVTCYPYSIFENPKSYDMQNIHAILTGNFKVMTMARFMAFGDRYLPANFALTTDCQKSILRLFFPPYLINPSTRPLTFGSDV